MMNPTESFSAPDKWKRFLLFVCVLLVNIAIKSNCINVNSYDYDESISIKDVTLDFGHIKHEAEWDNNPPFYYYCIWVWHHVFDINEQNSRILSLIFISLAIGLFASFIYRRTNFITAAAVSLMMTAHNMLLYYAQTARSYSLVLLLGVLSTIFFFNYLEKKKLKDVLILGLINFLLIYTHYISGLFLLIQGFILLFFHRNLFLKYSWSYLICIILVFVRFTKKQFLNILGYNSTGTFWLQKPGMNDLNDAMASLCNNDLVKWLFVVAGIWAVSLWVKKTVKSSDNDLLLYSVLTSLGAIIVLFIASQAKPIFLSRYLIFSIPFIYLTIALVLNNTTSGKYNLIALSALVLISVSTYEFHSFRKENYRLMVNIIKSVKQKDDVVIINTKDDVNLFAYYYNKDFFLKKESVPKLAEENVFAVNTIQEVKDLENHFGKKIILLQQFQDSIGEKNVKGYMTEKYVPYFHTGESKILELTFFEK